MPDTRRIESLQLVEEDGGATVANAITENKEIIHLFSYYPDVIHFTSEELIGHSVSWARDQFIHRMKESNPPEA